MTSTQVSNRKRQRLAALFFIALISVSGFEHTNCALHRLTLVSPFMTASELAVSGLLQPGDIIESEIVVKGPNGTNIALPLSHFAIVVDNETMSIVHYRFKNEQKNALTPQKDAENNGSSFGVEANYSTGEQESPKLVENMIQSIEREVRSKLSNVKSMDDVRSLDLNCRGYMKNGVMDMLYQYTGGQRKVYEENLVRNIDTPVRLNNGRDGQRIGQPRTLLVPFSPPEIVRRARSRIGEEMFRLRDQNCETFAHWSRYGVNYYTEQGERFGATLEKAIADVDDICQRAKRDIVLIAEDEIGAAKSSAQGKTAGGCVLGALICGILAGPPGALACCAVAGFGTAIVSFSDAVTQAREKIENRVIRKMNNEYKTSLIEIVKAVIREMHLESIVQLDL